MKKLTCHVFFTITLLSSQQPNITVADVSVMIGRERGFDACSGISVTEVETNVHAEPNSASEIKNILKAGIRLWDCDWYENGDESWIGVIYRQQGEAECGPLSSSIPEAKEYEGPCASGWVRFENITGIAG